MTDKNKVRLTILVEPEVKRELEYVAGMSCCSTSQAGRIGIKQFLKDVKNNDKAN
jgi:hypothetical protein